MPYIICVNQPGCLPESDPYAVATIEEARAFAKDEVCDFHDGTGPEDPNVVATLDLTESGGVIGPLPDGYVIDVRKVSGVELARLAGLTSADPASRFTLPAILDAYNQQES